MKINNNIQALNAYRNLNQNQFNTSKNLEKLSSGLRINRAADDAAGLAISEKMRSQIRGLKQAERNAMDGISLMQTSEGAMQEVHTMLQRMRELAVQAANDTNTEYDREQIQKEIDQLKLEIDDISEKTEFNTRKLLNGFSAVLTTYDTNANSINLVDFPRVMDANLKSGDYQLAISGVSPKYTATQPSAGLGQHVDDIVFENFGEGAEAMKLGEYTLLVRDVEPNNYARVEVLDPDGLSIGSKVVEIGEKAIQTTDEINEAILSAQTEMTAAEEAIASAQLDIDNARQEIAVAEEEIIEAQAVITEAQALKSGAEDELGVLQTELNSLEELDEPTEEQTSRIQVLSGLIVEQQTIIGDQDQIINEQENLIANRQASQGTNQELITEREASQETNRGLITEKVALLEDLRANAIERRTVSGLTIDIHKISSAGTVKVKMEAEATMELRSVSNGSAVAIQAPRELVSTNGAFRYGGVEYQFKNNIKASNSDEGDFNFTVTNNALSFQIGPNTNQNVMIDIPRMDIVTLGIENVNVLTNEDANRAIFAFDQAINKLSEARSKLGAVQNRMEHTINNLQVTHENLTASESRIRDADMALEMTEFTRNNILNQSATAMLAQANQLPQGVLQLLQ